MTEQDIRSDASGNADQNRVVGEALFALAAFAVRSRERDVSLTVVSTLSTVERTGPRRLTDLAGTERVSQPSMTAIVNQLEGLGFVQRRSDPVDGRVVMVWITRAGRQYLRTLRRAGAAVFTTLIQQLAEPDATALRNALPALRHLVDLSTDERTGPLADRADPAGAESNLRRPRAQGQFASSLSKEGSGP